MGDVPGQEDGLSGFEYMGCISHYKTVFAFNDRKNFILMEVNMQHRAHFPQSGVIKNRELPICIFCRDLKIIGMNAQKFDIIAEPRFPGIYYKGFFQ